MTPNDVAKILGEFDAKCALYEQFTKSVWRLLNDILRARGIKVHSICGRTKTRESLESKLRKPESDYEVLENVTDVAGVRVISFFTDDAVRISEYFKTEFVIDEKNSVDKGALLDPDRFGYLSIHQIVSLAPNRTSLNEYNRFAGLKLEIQIRSILQHAWAEIEHDLGYKSKVAVPNDVKRSFSRLAGLLELGDDEFLRIRDRIECDKDQVSARIEESPQSVALDEVSYRALPTVDSFYRDLDLRLVKSLGITIAGDFSNATIEFELRLLEECGIKTVAELRQSLAKSESEVTDFSRVWFERYPPPQNALFPKNFAVIPMFYIRLAERRLQPVETEHILQKVGFAGYWQLGQKMKEVFEAIHPPPR
jgi:ppGpp synthetase/RelA/SpoT-type nucleotidyltranferase